MPNARMSLCITVVCFLPVLSMPQQTPTVNVGVISGVVVDETGTPVSDAEVDADNLDRSSVGKALRLALTDGSGAFTFDPIKFGTYKFYALKPGSGFPDTKFEIYAESYHKTTVSVSAASPSAFVKIMVGPKAGFVRLTVLDKNTHESIPNPTLVLRRSDTGVWVSASQDNGSPVLVPPSVSTQLTVEAKGYVSWSNYDPKNPAAATLLNIKSGEEKQLIVELIEKTP